MTRPLVLAHRGASAARRENTIEAFEVARSMGADGVELDVWLSLDGLLVVHHDADLADGRFVKDLSWRELPAHVPLLDPVIDACGSMVVNIEIKNDVDDPARARDAADAVAALVDRRELRDRVIVSSFSMAAVDRVRGIDATIPTAYITEKGIEAIQRTADHGHGAIHPGRDVPDAAYVEHARLHGLAINVWTVDDPARMLELAALGVDGIVTNVPDLALRVLAGDHE